MCERCQGRRGEPRRSTPLWLAADVPSERGSSGQCGTVRRRGHETVRSARAGARAAANRAAPRTRGLTSARHSKLLFMPTSTQPRAVGEHLPHGVCRKAGSAANTNAPPDTTAATHLQPAQLGQLSRACSAGALEHPDTCARTLARPNTGERQPARRHSSVAGRDGHGASKNCAHADWPSLHSHWPSVTVSPRALSVQLRSFTKGCLSRQQRNRTTAAPMLLLRCAVSGLRRPRMFAAQRCALQRGMCSQPPVPKPEERQEEAEAEAEAAAVSLRWTTVLIDKMNAELERGPLTCALTLAGVRMQTFWLGAAALSMSGACAAGPHTRALTHVTAVLPWARQGSIIRSWLLPTRLPCRCIAFGCLWMWRSPP